MSWNGNDAEHPNMGQRGFTLQVDGRTVPGVYWTPAAVETNRLVLLGHGGTTHKQVEYIVDMASRLAQRGISSMAIDGPGHGDRATADLGPGDFEAAWAGDGGHEGMLADWRAALDFIESEFGARPTGWWGLSMGTMMGLPVCATDQRIKVALLGLMGTWGPNGRQLGELAPQLACPVRFLVQWDDEIVPRDACLELFDRLGTSNKTLHANPGAHAAVPEFEISGSVDYLDHYLN